jgi:uncharacterized protein YdgA (DUF945 family)
MNRNARIGVALLGGVAVVAAAWAGGSIYAGRGVASELRGLAERDASASSVSIAAARHDTGLFSSAGSFEVRFDEHCSAPGDTGRAALKVDYRVSHLLRPGSMMRFDWTAVPAGEVGALLAKATNDALRMEGQGTVSYSREVASSLAMPELALGSGQEAMRVSASSGQVKLAGNALGLQWKTERIAGRGAGNALELVNLGLDIDLKDRTRGTGSVALSIDRVGTGFGSAEGFRLVTAAAERGDRTDVTITPSLRTLLASGQKAGDLSMQVSLRDLHTASLEAIQRIGSETCGFKSLKPEEEQRLRAAVRTALTGGLSLGIDGVKGTIGDGSLEGFLKVELKKAAAAVAATTGEPAAIDLATLLGASGELVVKGSMVNAQQRQMAVSMGFATEVQGGLKAAFEYSDGLLKANGRAFDAGALQVALATADRRLNTFLGVSMPVRDAPKSAPVAVLEAAPAADAPLAAPAVAAPAPLVNSATARPGPNTSAPPAQAGPVNSANSR